MREIPKKNYIILAFMTVGVVLLGITLSLIYKK